MQTLYLGKHLAGEVGEDGAVYTGTGRKRRQVGTVTQAGDVVVDGCLVGSVDNAGTVYDAEGRSVGSVNSRGIVSHGRRAIGSVQGSDPVRAGAVLLLIFGPSSIPPRRSDNNPAQDDGYGWIVWLVGGALALAAAFFVIAFVIASAVVWGVMLLLTVITALWLAGAVARSLTEQERAAVMTVTVPTKRGERTEIDPAFLRVHAKPFPILFLCLVPALGYGILVAYIGATQSRPGDQSNLAYAGAAVAAGAVVSYLGGRKILYRSLGGMLMRTDAPLAFIPKDWHRAAGYAGGGLALLLCMGGGVVAWHSAHQPAMEASDQTFAPATGTSSVGAASLSHNSMSPDNSASSHSSASQPPLAQSTSTLASSANVARLPGEHFPQTRTVLLSDAAIQGWSYAGVRYALNEIYARHHFPFKSAPIRHQFEQFSWYQADESLTNASVETLFTPTERANQHTLAHRRDALRLAGQAIK